MDKEVQGSEQKGFRERGIRRGGAPLARARGDGNNPAARRSPGEVAVAAEQRFVCDLIDGCGCGDGGAGSSRV